MKPIILFDMDGTLLDLAFDDFIWNEQLPIAYATLHNCSIQQSLAKFKDFYQQNQHSLAWYSSKAWQEKTGVDIIQLHHKYKSHVCARPQCFELLQYLKKNGFECWLLTNADLANLAFKCEILPHFSLYFKRMISSEEIGFAKEQIEFWHQLMKIAPFNPRNALMIDDNLKVLSTAQQFGIAHNITILQPSSSQPTRSPQDLAFPALDNLMQLSDYLQQHFPHLSV